MNNYKNINTGEVMAEKEYFELLGREFKDMLENDNLNAIVQGFRKNGKSLEQFKGIRLKMMLVQALK